MTLTSALDERLAFMQLDAAAQADIRGVKDIVRADLPGILDDFYDQVRATPATRSFFADDALIGSARARQLRHWDGISEGRFDASYVDAVTRVGEIHARIGLEPRWYIGGYALVLGGLVGAVLQARLPQRGRGDRALTARISAELSALVKATLLDMDFAISVYLEAAERNRVEAERRVLTEERQRVQRALGEALAALSQGDLTRRVADDIPAEYAGLRDSFNTAVSVLGETMTAVAVSTDGLTRGAQEIAEASDNLSRRTEQQAASLEQTAAALDEITATVRQSAQAADEASAHVARTRDQAGQSGEVMRQAIAAMTRIEESSGEISQIIGVIDEIAFQTNLLALNAGVEAARAGDAGRGFAVVAQEVRQLAQRSAEAAKEIKALISASTAQVATGVKLVGETGAVLQTIARGVEEIDGLVTGIARSAAEQASSLIEVNAAVNQMDQIVQQNAAMVEQTTAATAQLRGQTQDLDQRLRWFETGGANRANGAARREPPAQAVQPRLARVAGGDWQEF